MTLNEKFIEKILEKLNAGLQSHIVYLVILEGNGELFCKVGVTKYDVKTRFKNEKYTVIKERVLRFDSGITARGIESIILEQILDYKTKYKPNTEINGFTECYEANTYSEISKLFDVIEGHIIYTENEDNSEPTLMDILNEIEEPKDNLVDFVDDVETSTEEVISEEIVSGQIKDLESEELAILEDKSYRRKDKDSETIKWYDKNKQLHNSHGPAVIKKGGTMEFYKHGLKHREDGPAIMRSNGSLEYWNNGLKHREDGPAVIRSYKDLDGAILQWWINGVKTKEESVSKLDANNYI